MGAVSMGVPVNPHDLTRAGDWEGAKQFYIEQGTAPATPIGFVRELRDF